MAMGMNEKQWLRRNVKPFEGALLANSHLVQSSTIETLPGHVDFFGIKRVESPIYAGMPVGGRIIIFDSNGSPKYDSSIDEGSVFASEGGFVEIAGMPGDQFTIACEAAYR